MKVVLDFETANTDPEIDLPEVGADVYARHPATEVLCLVTLMPRGTTSLWEPGRDGEWLRNLAANPDIIFEAHFSLFEQMIWQHIMVPRYGFPEIPISRWSCTMARSYFSGLPGGLEKAAIAASIGEYKDTAASQFTIDLSKPMTQKRWMDLRPDTARRIDWQAYHQENKAILFDREDDSIQRVVNYCVQDCVVEHRLGEVAHELTDYERRVWEHDQLVQHRGVRVDAPFIHQAMKIVANSRDPMLREFSKITDGLAPTQDAKVRDWCAEHGLKLASLDKPTMKRLGIGEEVEEGQSTTPMPAEVRRVLEIRSMLGSSSIKKLPRMLVTRGPDDRVRGLTQYHGAGTGRWAGRLWQPQNFPRGLLDPMPSMADLVAAIMTGDHDLLHVLYGNPIAAVASALRGAIVPAPGHMLAVGDFAGIEMRVVLGLAGQHDKCKLLAEGYPVYFDMAEAIYGKPKGTWATTDKVLLKHNKEQFSPEYTIGKNTVLGCGFQMGGPTFHDRYCPHMPTQFAKDVVNSYRTDWAPLVPKLWYGLENAALAAMQEKSEKTAYNITYRYVEKGSSKWLGCFLPDGQVMWYYDPEYAARLPDGHPQQGTWRDKPHWTYWAFKDGVWKKLTAYGGLLTENVVQKLARGILVEALYRLEANGYPVILTVHDEAVCEPLSAHASWEEFKQIMSEPSDTARALGVPIEVEGYVEDRYRK